MTTPEAWISSISTIVLVLVTGWYAWLTRRLAKSAEASAASAERTAQIAAQALAASVAGVDVRFTAAPNYQLRADETGALGVSIFCDGATAFIHEARLDWAYECTDRRADGASYDTIASGVDLVLLVDEDEMLPARVHRGEALHFITDPEVTMSLDAGASRLEVSVWYTLDGIGEPVLRRAEYDDFEEQARLAAENTRE
ncbi:hypothetical protein [Microbacterium esteraromaticum]|uniref:hypothetical protein n=1 Tax=Microbacterium esteraromaticum TaxID=57043 RepID=UPI00195F1790|nr:hypothetical protein [Microbacterium esteraromaticum]MBM7464631.1 hypothetical protein [Microbacterium esteraromaticum]